MLTFVCMYSYKRDELRHLLKGFASQPIVIDLGEQELT